MRWLVRVFVLLLFEVVSAASSVWLYVPTGIRSHRAKYRPGLSKAYTRTPVPGHPGLSHTPQSQLWDVGDP